MLKNISIDIPTRRCYLGHHSPVPRLIPVLPTLLTIWILLTHTSTSWHCWHNLRCVVFILVFIQNLMLLLTPRVTSSSNSNLLLAVRQCLPIMIQLRRFLIHSSRSHLSKSSRLMTKMLIAVQSAIKPQCKPVSCTWIHLTRLKRDLGTHAGNVYKCFKL